MKLQLALDDLTWEEALQLMDKVGDQVDIIELGTPFLMEYGMEAVRQFRKRFPEHELLADLKIMDAGCYEAGLAFRTGADYVTVLGVTDLLTIRGCQKAAEEYGGKVYVDMICVDNLPERIKAVESLGVHGISVHVGVDQQAAGRKPIDDLQVMIAHRKQAEISVAGGINSRTAKMYKDAGADVLICGSGICHAPDPRAEAEAITAVLY